MQISITSLSLSVLLYATAAAAQTTTPAPVQPANYTGLAQFTSFSKSGVSACGERPKDSQFVLGVDAKTFGNGDAVCGRQIRIYAANGKTHKGTIVDSCGKGCGKNGLNLSPTLFEVFYPKAKGTFTATWKYV